MLLNLVRNYFISFLRYFTQGGADASKINNFTFALNMLELILQIVSADPAPSVSAQMPEMVSACNHFSSIPDLHRVFMLYVLQQKQQYKENAEPLDCWFVLQQVKEDLQKDPNMLLTGGQSSLFASGLDYRPGI